MPRADGFEPAPATVAWTVGVDGAQCGRVVGEVDALNRDAVLAEITARVAACSAAGTAVAIDLADVAFCDARTLVGLARVVADAEAAGASAALVSVPAHLARILALVTGSPGAVDPSGPSSV